MSRYVSQLRPEPADSIRVSSPVSGGLEWSAYAQLANWINGRGAMIVPWANCNSTVASGSESYRFYVGPCSRAVERVWVLNLRANTATGVTCTVRIDGDSSTDTIFAPTNNIDRRVLCVVRQPLTAKTSTAADATVTVTTSGGTTIVDSIACYEQARATLDATTDDYSVDVVSCNSRRPIAAFDYQSVSGVADAYKNLDARRPGYFYWSTNETGANAITAGVGSPTDLLESSVPMAGAIATLGATTTTVTVAALAKVGASETGSIRFQSTEAADSVTLSITSTAYAWVTGELDIATEDLTQPDGRRNTAFEAVSIDAWVSASGQLDVWALSILRPATANPI